MKRVYILTLALALLLTACTAGAPADSEVPSATETQTVAPETAAPSEIPGSESTAPVESPVPESTAPAETPTSESSAPAETAAPTSEAPTQTRAPANTAPAETYAPASSAPETASPESAAPVQIPEPTNPIKEQESNTMTITINGQTFLATLYDNETVAALKEKMPLTLNMSELNGNEKYNYLPFSLPTNAGNPGQIHAGDLMLYGSDCLVLFYESFPTSYRYTPIGRVNDPSGLADTVGGGSVQVTFAAQ